MEVRVKNRFILSLFSVSILTFKLSFLSSLFQVQYLMTSQIRSRVEYAHRHVLL